MVVKQKEDIFTLSTSSNATASSVLFFEFTDGELRPKVNRKKGYAPYIKLRTPAKTNRINAGRRELKLPEFSPGAITRLINKRNNKFRKALNSHLEYCYSQVRSYTLSTSSLSQESDPWSRLVDISSKYFPVDLSDAPMESLPPEYQRLETSRCSMRDLIQQLELSDDYRDQIVPEGHRTFPEHLAEYGNLWFISHLSPAGDLSRPISAELTDALLSARGISQVYSHQAKAINDLWNDKHVIVSTSTASGKSLIYQLPVIDALERDRDVKALYIFPTKALAQDQKKSFVNILSNMKELSDVLVETFDGDTPQANRTRIRENASGSVSFSLSTDSSDFYKS